MTETAAVSTPISLNHAVDSIRKTANMKLDEKLRGKLGQFMSSSAVSELLTDMFESFTGDIRLLDAGAGVGSLTAAFVDKATLNFAQSISSKPKRPERYSALEWGNLSRVTRLDSRL